MFFEAAGIRWLYEHQGFDVNGTPYLPDFYLPDFGYFEVRGPSVFDEKLMQAFADEMREPIFLALDEIPNPDSSEGYLKSFIPKGARDDFADCWGSGDMFLQCDDCGKITVQNEAYCSVKSNCCEGARGMSISRALLKARSARFEHGECPG